MSAFDNIRNLNSIYEQTRGFNSLIEATKFSRINYLNSSAFNRINHLEKLHQSSIQKTAEAMTEAQRRLIEPITAAARLHRSYMQSIEKAMKPMIGAEKLWQSTMQKSMESWTAANQRVMYPVTNAGQIFSSSIHRQAGIDKKIFDPYPDSEFKENVDPDLFDKRLSIERSMIEEELKLQEKVQGDTPSPKGSLNNLSSRKSNWFQEKLKTMRYLIPIKYREAVLGDVLETRNKMKLDGLSNWWINFISLMQISIIAWSMLKIRVSDHVNPSQDTNGDS